MRTIITLLITGLLVASAATPAAAAASPEPTTATADASPALDQEDNDTAPADPDEDVIGWENGYWHNESVDVDRSDGLNESERRKVVNRSMARVEEIRDLEFQEDVPIEVISRDEYRNVSMERFRNMTADERLHQNVKWEATFFVNESTDAVEVQSANFGSSVLGFYSPEEDRMVIVSENQTSPRLEGELTLGHELHHALQDQQYNLSSIRANTTDGSNANSGLIEGDASFVEYRYEQRCGEEWDCLDSRSGQQGGELANFGLYLVSYQPYSDGAAFVQHRYEQGGWEAVNEVYDATPESTEQVIYPDRYLEDSPTNVTVEDRSSDEWGVLELNGSIDYASFGEAGMFTMFMYPYYESNQRDQLIDARSFFNFQDGSQELDPIDPLNYTHRYTEGWDGDRLVPYVADDSAETNETGYVWASVWDSEADAEQFATGYRELLEYRGAESVEGYEGVYRIPDDGEFDDAFYVEQRGDRVVVVNAPTLDDLSAVHGAAPDVSESDWSAGDGGESSDGETTDGESTDVDGNDTDDGESAEDMPGFGVGAALVALVAAVLIGRRA
ncbi:PGF-CTERM sorting domain-containing protein [Halostella sp. JP-L12]|uniref:Hvo_1808 family surface protein n=1 Tax=Halostella TaxID=1843185 RepID=UPI000EF7F447|nr:MULTISPECIES: Hvo_1808 family surface protein [Halostella]NHN48327.1 PGF-CTERM sorting domain-containing protein [Halostella sp. JP-L12]